MFPPMFPDELEEIRVLLKESGISPDVTKILQGGIDQVRDDTTRMRTVIELSMESITFLYFVSRRHEDERKKKAGPFRPGLWCSALRIYLGKSSSATSATLRSPYIAR